MKAQLEMGNMQEYIHIYPDGHENDIETPNEYGGVNPVGEHLWHGIIEHCAKRYTNNQIIKIYQQCKEQLLKLDPNDIPPIFNEMLDELKVATLNRGLNPDVSPISKEEQIRLKKMGL